MRFGKRVNFHLPAPLLLSVIGIGVYWNALWNPFQYDDGSTVVNNPYIRSISNLPRFFFVPRLSQLIDDAGAVIHYRPLWTASFAINYAIGGLNPFGYHLVNLGFHIGSAYLLFLIVKAMLPHSLSLRGSPERSRRDRPSGLSESEGPPIGLVRTDLKVCPYRSATYIALAAALIFLVHPFNSEVVNYISARSSVMCAFFYLLAFYFWVKYRTPPPFPPPRGGRVREGVYFYYIASLLAFLMAMLTKEIAITLPIILFLYDLYSSKLSREPFMSQRGSLPYLPFILPISIPLTMLYLGDVHLSSERGFIVHLYTQAGVIIKYLKLFFLPLGLSIDHDIKIYQTFFTPGVFVPALFLVLYLGISIFLLRSIKREWWWVSFFMLFFFITILPTTVVPLHAPLQENRGYLPFAGIMAAGGILSGKVYSVLSREGRQRWRLMFTLSLIILIVVYSTGTISRNRVWRDRFTLWADAVKKAPDSPRAHANLAYAYTLRKEDDMAMKEYLQALRLDSKNAGLHNDVATFYYKEGDLEKAEHHLKIALMLQPDYYIAYTNLGLLYERLGRPKEAVPFYLKALELNPEFATAHDRLKRTTMSIRNHRKGE